MGLQTVDHLKYWTFGSFPDNQVGHGIFARHGGISPNPWNSLNLGGTVGDSPDNVVENRRIIFQSFHRPVESLYDVWQVHSADVVWAYGPREISSPHIRADAILTNNPDVTLLMRFADCVPVLLYDPIHHAVGLVHAGWQGTVRFVVKRCYTQLAQNLYEIGNDVVSQVENAFGEYSEKLLFGTDQHVRFDLWEANRRVLELSGVRKIETAGICTACNRDDWFSHRADKGKTGRFGAVIFLRN